MASSDGTRLVALRFQIAAEGGGVGEVSARTGASRESTLLALDLGVPSVAFLKRFCLAYGVNPDWLLFERGPRHLLDVCDGAATAYATLRLLPALRHELDIAADQPVALAAFEGPVERMTRIGV